MTPWTDPPLSLILVRHMTNMAPKLTRREMKRVRRRHCVDRTDDTVPVAGMTQRSRHTPGFEMYIV